jgi:ketosteroid isomerase-like protein
MDQNEATKRELLALEQRYWNAIKAKDAATATSLSADPCIVVGAQGIGEVARDNLAKMIEAAPYELKTFSLEDVHLRPVSDGVFALAYKVKENLTVDGKKVELEAYDSSVWVRRNGSWECAVHTESLAGDPFGRR